MTNVQDAAGNLLPVHLTELVDRQVEGSVVGTRHKRHDCPSEPVGQMRQFESTDGAISIQWCEGCKWYRLQRRSGRREGEQMLNEREDDVSKARMEFPLAEKP